MAENWYELIGNENGTLRQGDLLEDCPIIFPPEDLNKIIEGEQEIEYDEINVIVLSQSCDLVANKISIVQVCPYYEIHELDWIEVSSSEAEKNQKKESMRRGYVAGYHMLHRSEKEAFVKDFLAVDFRNTYGVDINFLHNFVQKQDERLRLNSPYKEHLSQAFARFFMRVGLPSDIPAFR